MLGNVIGYPTIALPQFKNETNSDLHLNESLDSWFASMRLFSSVLMCVPGGIISSKIGRCKIIIFSVPFVLAGWLMIAFAANKIMLFSGRILTCLFVSLYFTSTGVYISETVHPDIRGSLVVLSPFFMASGNTTVT